MAAEIFTDWTITWTDVQKATLSWTSVSSYWWAVYVDGTLVTDFQDSGTIEQTVYLDSSGNHVISIIRHDSQDDELNSPDLEVLVHPTIRWTGRDGAYQYEIYQVDKDGNLFLLHIYEVTDDNESDFYSWRPDVALPVTGTDTIRMTVYAKSPYGYHAVPNHIGVFVCSHSFVPLDITGTEDSEGDLYLNLSSSKELYG